MFRKIRRAIAVTAMLALTAPTTVQAQNQDFYLFQYNTALRELNVAQSRVQELEDEMSRTHDFTRGCSLLSQTIGKLGDIQSMLEKMADYASHLQYGEETRDAAVEAHGTTTAHKAELQAKYSRLCG